MKTLMAVSGLDGLVYVPLAHGTVLVLTQAEFTRGISRGKAYTRAGKQAAREQAWQARQESARLAWMDQQDEGAV